MERLVAERTVVDDVRRALAARRVVLEPRSDDGAAEWRETAGVGAFEWTSAAPLAGAKRWFFPARETVLRWDADGDAREEPVAAAPFALVGLRPCDLAAIAYQDRFFAEDARYQARRAAAFLVAVDCTRACAGGFCVEMGTGPFAPAGFDLALTALPDGRVVVTCGTAMGRALIAEAGVPGAPFDAAAARAFAETETAARASFPSRPYVARALARVNAVPGAGAVADDEWQALGPSCLACTGCTSLCPTCSCFTVVDEADGAGGGARVRVWDSCLLEGFQREASGHHPAPRPGDRVRRFWYHKLSRDFAGADGRLGCVACGRCDVGCPGSIGALAVMAALGRT